MIVSTRQIGGYNQSNSPFIRTLYVIDKDNVIAVLDPERYKLPGSSLSYIPFGGIRIKDGTEIISFKFPIQTCVLSNNQKRSDAGHVSEVQIDFPIPASREDVNEWYNQNRQKQFVLLYEDNNWKSYIAGNEERGARPSISQTISSVNENNLAFTGTFNVPVFLLRPKGIGIDLAEMFPDTDYSTDFSLDFNA